MKTETPEQRGQLRSLRRRNILLQLEAASPAPVSVSTLKLGLEVAGFAMSEQQLAQDLDYLVGKDQAARQDDSLSAGHAPYALTAQGRDYLEERGLI